MTAELLLSNSQIAADRAAWLKAREPLVTASEIAAVMDLMPGEYGAAFTVWSHKVHGPPDDQPTPAQLRGRHLEPVIADMLRDQLPAADITEGGLYRNTTRPWQGSTLDALLDGEPAEYKTVGGQDYENWGRPGGAVMPLHYRMQALWQLDTMDAWAVCVAALKMLPWRLDLYWLTRETPGALRDIELMRQAAEELLARVASGEPPPLTWAPATARELRRIYPLEPLKIPVRVPAALARRRTRAAAAKKRAEERLGLADNELALRMKGAQEAVALGADGKLHTVVRRVEFDRAPYTVKATRVDYLRGTDEWTGG